MPTYAVWILLHGIRRKVRRNLMKKKWKSLKPLTAVFCAAALTLGLTACSGGNTSADTGSASDTESASSAGQEAAGSGSASGRTDLNLRISDAFSTVDPHNLSLNSDIMLSRQVYEPLYWINDEGEEIPMLATEYSVSEDGLTWTFQLREGVTFQNGDPLTAQDVVYSYERCFDNAYMQEKVEAIDSVTAPDDSTVEMHLKYQFSPLMEKIAAIGIVSQSFAEANMDDQGLLGFNACGTGAYSVKEAIPDVSITLEAYSGYWGGEAPIKTLNFEQITDETTAVTAFEAGEIDVMSIPSANWAQISESGQYNTDSRPSNHVVYLIFNTEAAPFDNRELRQAIAYAINREDIIAVAADGLADPATSLATSYMLGYTEDHMTYEYDPEKAKELLAEAGYPDGLDIGSMKTMSGSYFEKVMQVVQSQLAEIGITSTIEGMDGNSLVEDCITGNFTLADMGQNLSLDYDFLKTYFNEEYINGLNMARVSDSQIQELFEQGASTTDKEERLAIYQEIEDLTQELCAYVPLYNLQTTTAWNKDLNYTPSVTGVLYKDCSWN